MPGFSRAGGHDAQLQQAALSRIGHGQHAGVALRVLTGQAVTAGAAAHQQDLLAFRAHPEQREIRRLEVLRVHRMDVGRRKASQPPGFEALFTAEVVHHQAIGGARHHAKTVRRHSLTQKPCQTRQNHRQIAVQHHAGSAVVFSHGSAQALGRSWARSTTSGAAAMTGCWRPHRGHCNGPVRFRAER